MQGVGDVTITMVVLFAKVGVMDIVKVGANIWAETYEATSQLDRQCDNNIT